MDLHQPYGGCLATEKIFVISCKRFSRPSVSSIEGENHNSLFKAKVSVKYRRCLLLPWMK